MMFHSLNRISQRSSLARNASEHYERLFLTAVTCTCLLLMSTASFAQVRSSAVRHFTDINTDRVPALTAFPKYPSIARRDRIQGEATVCFKIRANGKISRAVVTEKTHRIFSKPALRAIRKSSFEPIGPGQLLATARTCRIYRFRLDPVVASNSQ